MAGYGGAAVEELGRRADWHPGFCHRRHSDGQRHESPTVTTGTRTIAATAGDDWKPTVRIEGAGVMLPGEAVWLTAVRAWLEPPAGSRP